MATSTIPQVIENVDVISPSYTVLSPSVTFNAITFIRKGHELVIDVNMNVSSPITHGTNLFSVAGTGLPVTDNAPNCLLKSGSNIACVRAKGTGQASILITSNGSITEGTYAGNILVFTK